MAIPFRDVSLSCQRAMLITFHFLCQSMPKANEHLSHRHSRREWGGCIVINSSCSLVHRRRSQQINEVIGNNHTNQDYAYALIETRGRDIEKSLWHMDTLPRARYYEQGG